MVLGKPYHSSLLGSAPLKGGRQRMVKKANARVELTAHSTLKRGGCNGRDMQTFAAVVTAKTRAERRERSK